MTNQNRERRFVQPNIANRSPSMISDKSRGSIKSSGYGVASASGSKYNRLQSPNGSSKNV